MKKPKLSELQKDQFTSGYEKGEMYRARLQALLARLKNLFRRESKDV